MSDVTPCHYTATIPIETRLPKLMMRQFEQDYNNHPTSLPMSCMNRVCMFIVHCYCE